MSSAGTLHSSCCRCHFESPSTSLLLRHVFNPLSLYRWCAEGGKLICCDYCNNAFCKKCILRNLGRKELSVITNENSKWHCYVCRSEPLQDLVSKCHAVMQRKMENEDRESKKPKSKPVREHKAVINGKEEAEGSGTMTFSYKRLHIPKELMKKVKKLVETTAGLNNTFIQFIQQAAAKQSDKSIRYRHLKAFKAVLADLKKAHCCLEEALACEFSNVEVQNGREGQGIVTEVTGGVEPVKNDSVEADGGPADGTDGAEEMDGEQHQEQDEEPSKELSEEQENQQDEEAEQDSSEEKVADGTDAKDCRSETEAMANPVKTDACDDELLPAAETSLDHDIMSVPPSVPEELFQMVESLADSTMLLQNDAGSFSDSEKNAENAESNSTESQRPQPKVKNLIVKLTPVPVVTTCGSKSSRSKNKERDEDAKSRGKEEESEEKARSSPPPSRRSSRLKTTPKRKQAENKDKQESSEVDEDVKSKAKSSKKCSNAQTGEGVQVKTADSDSDEVPQALLAKAAAGHSTDEEQEGARGSKKCLFKSNNTSAEDADKASKRKRKSESSDTDLEQKGKKVSKKKKQKDSESSDSDLEKSKSKGSAPKRRRERVKKKDASKEESKNSPERRASDRKRSYEKKHKRKGSKAASKLQTSSSEDEEELRERSDSEEDSDVQKIKPIVEDALVGADGAFHQSSGTFRHDRAHTSACVSAPMTSLWNIGFVIHTKKFFSLLYHVCFFCKGDEVDGKDGISRAGEDEDEEDPENRYLGEKLAKQKVSTGDKGSEWLATFKHETTSVPL